MIKKEDCAICSCVIALSIHKDKVKDLISNNRLCKECVKECEEELRTP